MKRLFLMLFTLITASAFAQIRVVKGSTFWEIPSQPQDAGNPA